MAKPPVSRAAAAAAASLRSRIVTLTPAAASASAVARPRPEAPPLTMAACSSISIRPSADHARRERLSPRRPRGTPLAAACQSCQPCLAVRDIDRGAGDDGGSYPGPDIGHLAEPQEADQRRERQPSELEGRAGAGIGRGERPRNRKMGDRAEAAEPEERGE